MIARGMSHAGNFEPSCDQRRLVALLDETLPPDECVALTAHLDSCARCRQHLETLAGDQDDWMTMRDCLRGDWPGDQPPSAVAGPTGQRPARQSHGVPAAAADMLAERGGGCEVSWVRSLLKPSPQSELGTLGPYVIRGVIGQGGMGVVLQGWDEELSRPLAIKLLAPHLASSGPARQRFLREARAAAAVVHPNVVPIYSVTADSTVPYLVMPLINGGNLQQRIDRDGPLDLEDCLRIGLQITEGLAAAHRQGLIHRDIKPANMLLEEGGHRVLISDFGLARALDDVSMTLSGMIAGTPPYMSPEQARGESIQIASDLYSLGSVLYAMSTGRAPYRGESPLAVLRQIGEQTPTPVCEINERLPRWFERLIDVLMQNEATARPESADAVADLLRGCLSHVRDGHLESLPRRLRVQPKPARYPLVGGAMAVGITFTLAIAMLGGSRSTPTSPGTAVGVPGPASLAPDALSPSQLSPSQGIARPDEASPAGQASFWRGESIDDQLRRAGRSIHQLYRDIESELQTIHQEAGTLR